MSVFAEMSRDELEANRCALLELLEGCPESAVFERHTFRQALEAVDEALAKFSERKP